MSYRELLSLKLRNARSKMSKMFCFNCALSENITVMVHLLKIWRLHQAFLSRRLTFL